ncbi:hypothetical protein [Angelakisella massiliensis]|uniref:hypothetical protein n=1 Tax=Angelakisella massiliensis TaxID=1871018 RepID=UPI0024B18B8C|nr:hypothetical protein [Angelakisella massiliensis]
MMVDKSILPKKKPTPLSFLNLLISGFSPPEQHPECRMLSYIVTESSPTHKFHDKMFVIYSFFILWEPR